MPASALYDQRFLNSARIQDVIETAASYLERMRPLTFLDRLELTNARDDELMGRFTARLFAADLIADGQKALIYSGGKVELFATSLPNIKIGLGLEQNTLNMLHDLQDGIGRATDEDAAFDWLQRMGENLLQGVRERQNEMACAMMLDAYTYNQWGVQLAGATWGMPANLKVTPSPLWSTDAGVTVNAAATPLSNLFALDIVDANNYGLGVFDRVTMSGQAFDIMTSTTEFANKAWMMLGAAFLPTPAALKTNNRPEMQELARRVLGKEVTIDDKTVRTQNAAGAQTTTRVLPANKVLLDRTSNGRREWDFGNGVVTESIVGALTGGTTLGMNPKMAAGGAYGPLGYFTAQSPDMNPPGVLAFGVARGFPRKMVSESSAVLTVW